MVLQRDMPVPFWGTASSGEQVSVSVGSQTKTMTTPASGKWSVKLDAMPAGGPYVVTVKGNNTVTLEDVYVGEVWQAAGQSNMDTRLSFYSSLASEISQANYPLLRYYTLRQPGQTTTWKVVSPSTAGPLSALAYFFGKEIQQKTGVAVGLVVTAVGGTKLSSWLDPATLSAHSEVKDSDRGSMWNAWVAPVAGYGLRGTIWFQGEQNTNGTDAASYGERFNWLIHGWRAAWGQGDFPFFFGQLSNIHDAQTDPNNTSNVATVREGQRMALALPNTAMSVNMDIGVANDWHFPNKPEAGHRLALPARAKVYGETGLVHSGPFYVSKSIAGDEVTLTFEHVGGGLVVSEAGPLKGFAIAGATGSWVWADAAISGNTVVVSSPTVPSPTRVRYAWGDNPVFSLYNQEGLPAMPFTTESPDVMPPSTGGMAGSGGNSDGGAGGGSGGGDSDSAGGVSGGGGVKLDGGGGFAGTATPGSTGGGDAIASSGSLTGNPSETDSAQSGCTCANARGDSRSAQALSLLGLLLATVFSRLRRRRGRDPTMRYRPARLACTTLRSRHAILRRATGLGLALSLGCSSAGNLHDGAGAAHGGSGGSSASGATSASTGGAGSTGVSGGAGTTGRGIAGSSGGAIDDGSVGTSGSGGQQGGGGHGGGGGATGSGGGGEERSAGCGKVRTLQDGNHMVQSGGMPRSYALRAPVDYDSSRAYRLILSFHGATDSSSDVAPGYFGLWDLSQGSTIFVAPDAIGGIWKADTDTQMVEALLEQLEGELCIDTSRIVVEGFSQGGAMAWTLACALPGTFQAAIVHSGGGLAIPQTCQPIPFFSALGDDGNGQGMSSDAFAAINGCTVKSLPLAPNGGHACTDYEGCSPGHPTRWCAYDGGHTPAHTDSGQTKSWVPQEVWSFVTQF
jgi:hypothetical protein